MRLEPQFALGFRNVPMTLRMYAPNMQWPLTGAITGMLSSMVDGTMHRTQGGALPTGFMVTSTQVVYSWPRIAPQAPEAVPDSTVATDPPGETTPAPPSPDKPS